MSEFNTFCGKTVDEAINEACRFFAVERGKLEVEILTGGSTGIFGLVGKKKAQVKARRRIDPAVAGRLAQEACVAASPAAAPLPAPVQQHPPVEAAGVSSAPGTGGITPRQETEAKAQELCKQTAPAPGAATADASPAPSGPRRERPQKKERAPGPRQEKPRRERSSRSEPGQPAVARPAHEARARQGEDDLPEGHDHSPASPELLQAVRGIMSRLLTPILEHEPAMEIEGTASRVSVSVLDEENSGLLIGREGQTLASLQYIANRILARRWEAPVRVQINTGEYREKQDENLRRMAVYLADKARSQGRAQSTKPLSSYHRRVIHLTLQDDETIQTRSKGEGPMKRVIIAPRRSRGDLHVQPQGPGQELDQDVSAHEEP